MEVSLQGRFLGPYCLTRQLGAGGFAPVWLADEIHDGKRLREVAVKLFRAAPRDAPSPEASAILRDAIIEEARSLCRVEHPSVVRFYSLQRDDTDGLIGLAMEYIPGRSIKDRMDKEGALDEKVALEVAINVAWALAAVHDAGLVHRDIKPANVIEGTAGYRLIDFGIAAAQTPIESGNPAEETAEISIAPMSPAEDKEPTPGARADAVSGVMNVVGTKGYIAPEYFSRQSPATPTSDLYGLGAMIYKMLTKKVPAAAAATLKRSYVSALLHDVLIGRVDAPRMDAVIKRPLSPALIELTALLLRPNPRERPRHADWVARELEKIRTQIAPAAAPQRSAPVAEPTATTAPQRSEKRLSVRIFDLLPRFVGRNEERQRIKKAAGKALEGSVGFVLISGAFGVGRTRLLDTAVGDCAANFPLVLRLRGSPERRGSLRPWIRAIEQLQGLPAFTTFAPLQTAIGRALAPQALGAPNDLDEALEGVEDALLAVSRGEPVLIAFDDLQWADAHSLTLLSMLLERAGRPGAPRLLVVAAVRSEPNAPAHLKAFLRQVRMHKSIVRLPLEPLSREEAIELTQGICPMTRELQQAVLRVSGSVPFFMVHALRAWHETGALAVEETREGALTARLRDDRVITEDVPGVGDFIRARLESYFEAGGDEERAALQILTAIALYGGGLTIDVIAAASKVEERSIEGALETLLDAGILGVDAERQEYTFAQEMVRQALLNLTRRKPWFPRLFRALLDVLAEGPEERRDAAFLARGYDKLGVKDAVRKWLARAMADAFASGLFADAVEFGERRIALSASVEEQFGIELEIVEALFNGRKFDDARRRLEDLEQRRELVIDSPAGRALDLRRRAYRLFVARGLRAQGILDETLVHDADALGDPRISCEARIAAAGVVGAQEALTLIGDAITLAARTSEMLEFRARMLRYEIYTYASHPDFAGSQADLTRALAIAKSMGSSWKQMEVETDWANVEAETGRIDEAILRLQRLAQQAEDFGIPGQRRLILLNLSAYLLRADRDVEALTTSETAERLAKENGDPYLWMAAISTRADALRRSGALKEALDAAEAALQVQRERGGMPRAASITLLRRAEILDALGRGEEGLEDAREARRISEQHGFQDLGLGALLWEQTRLARSGRIGASELAETVAAAKSGSLRLRPGTLRFLAEAERWLNEERREAKIAGH